MKKCFWSSALTLMMSVMALSSPLLSSLAKASGSDSRSEISILIGSKHVSKTSFNEVNPGVVYSYYPDRTNGFHFFGGGYRNSLDRNSLVFGVGNSYEVPTNSVLTRVNLKAGLVSGYNSDFPTPALPAIIPQVELFNFIVVSVPVSDVPTIGFGIKLPGW